MSFSNEELKLISQKIYLSRSRLLFNHPFYGLILMDSTMKLSTEIQTAATDGNDILLSPNHVKKASDLELDFTILHELLHIVLKHPFRAKDFGIKNFKTFNIAADIIVNSIAIYELNISKSIFNSWNLISTTYKGKEGYKYSLEELYLLLLKDKNIEYTEFDSHDKWNKDANQDEDDKGEDTSSKEDIVTSRVSKVLESKALQGKKPSLLFSQENFKLLYNIEEGSSISWIELLNGYIQDEIVDYSFNRNDYRFDEFFIPSFSEKDEKPKDVLIYVDTSGSITEDDLSKAMSEIKNIIDQFDDKLKGKIYFFGSKIYGPYTFEDKQDIDKIRPDFGGGTDFSLIHDSLLKDNYNPFDISSVIILTDGEGEVFYNDTAYDIIWLIIGDNKDFKAENSRVIFFEEAK